MDQPGTIPAEMVRITGREIEGAKLPDFFIDSNEVTNRKFREFVSAGGYQKKEYWKEEFVKDGRTLSWDEAMAEFRDTTGRPGPATWQAGDFPDGQAEYPVGGEWYEAAAYAEFAGKACPPTPTGGPRPGWPQSGKRSRNSGCLLFPPFSSHFRTWQGSAGAL